MKIARNTEILGYGYVLPSTTVTFDGGTRYRFDSTYVHRDMLVAAGEKALADAGLLPEDLDCIIGAVAADIQPIPCTAALVMEKLAPTAAAAALDVNSTCTSFITALDVASRYIRDGEYSRVLIVAGDVGSQFLNPQQRESFELFSDATVAFVVGPASAESGKGIVASMQQTWPKHAHDTEIRGGGTGLPGRDFTDENAADYLFDMNGRAALLSMARILPEFFDRFYAKAGVTLKEIDYVIPHQASRALELIMQKLGIEKGKYADYVTDYGNMVSSSVPFALAKSLEAGSIGPGSTVMLCGTAAGLTANALLLKL